MFEHVTVMQEEAVRGLRIKPEGIYVDCTVGGAGHSTLIAAALNSRGHLIGIDQDQTALDYASRQLEPSEAQTTFIKSNFRHLGHVLNSLNISAVDGFLFDLGVSSPQLDQSERGFSYQHDAPLDMRMDQNQPLSAFEVVNEWPEKKLADLIYRYGEERFARRIARQIVQKRAQAPIESTLELVECIKQSIPAKARSHGPHPAKRTFQAIRIAVNDELQALAEALKQTVSFLAPRGRIVVITFHSLEDRICKQFFQRESQGCVCPPDFPQCVCARKRVLKVITKKPIVPSRKEVEENPRSRSAKLRIAEKC